MNPINLAGTQLELYGALAFGNLGGSGQPYYFLAVSQSTVVLGVDALAQVFVSDAAGPVGGVMVAAQRDDGRGEVFATDPGGLVEFHFGAGSAFSPPGAPPLHLFVALNPVKDPETHLVSFDAKLSDEIWVGDTHALHTHWRLKLWASAVAPPAPAVVPELTSPVDASLRDLAWHMRGVSFNPDAALYKVAHARALGSPLSSEFPFRVGVVPFVAQLFSGGILYCIIGDWANVRFVEWV